MHIISTNTGTKRTIEWKGRKVETGIYKYPVEGPIYLGKFGVQNDAVADLKVHGGIDKSCYLYSHGHYQHWKDLYPDLEWDWGMFGENITVKGLDETGIHIGDIYEVGEAHIQVSQPRQPCYKLGVRFGNQKVLKEFIRAGYSGVYARVLKEGWVKKGDELKLIIRSKSGKPISEIFKLLYEQDVNRDTVEDAIFDGNLSQSIKEQLHRKLA